MKVFVSCDMEGVAGIVDWEQCRPSGGAAYAAGCRLMQGEVNAATEGAVEGGADEVVVNDSHGSMFNLDPAALPRAASYISGRHKPGYMMEGLDESFGAVFFVGYHGSISGEASALSHTYNPEVIAGVRLNGTYVGESGINALLAHSHRVPIALLTGDSATLAEAETFAPDVVGVMTKESRTRFSAHHLHPAEACEKIRAAAREAVQRVLCGEIATPTITTPAELEVELQTADMAEVAAWVKGVERADTRTVRIVGERGSEVYASFVALTYITRQAGGR
ncbi:MAG: M55 family metallopeptidase [Nocardioidaceae bacterium]|nr:M55 family metallopeptidase [Nocardioidaceae bacterium]